MIKATKVLVLPDFQLQLVFSDGTSGTFDCQQIVSRAGSLVVPLRDPQFFARVFLENGAPTWPNGYDMAPWALHKELQDAGLLKKTAAAAE